MTINDTTFYLKKLKEKSIAKTAIFDVVEKEYKDLNFKPVGINAKDWVMIIAKDSDEKDPVCVFVKQTRWGWEHSSIEFPCGTVEEGEDVYDVAAREFLEETGIQVSPSSLVEVATYNVNPAFLNNTMHVFMFTDKGLIKKFLEKQKQNLDEHEDCEVFISRLSSQKVLLRKHANGCIAVDLIENIRG